MKVMICGKGGSGKSTVTVLLARALRAAGKSVLVVDADESNLCLHRLLGASLPAAVKGRSGCAAMIHLQGGVVGLPLQCNGLKRQG